MSKWGKMDELNLEALKKRLHQRSSQQHAAESLEEDRKGPEAVESPRDFAGEDKDAELRRLTAEMEEEAVKSGLARELRDRLAAKEADEVRNGINFLIRNTVHGPKTHVNVDVKWDEVSLAKFLAEVPRSADFYKKFVVEAGQKAAAVLNDPNSSEQAKEQAKKDRWNAHYIAEHRQELEAVLYGSSVKTGGKKEKKGDKSKSEVKPASSEISAIESKPSVEKEERMTEAEVVSALDDLSVATSEINEGTKTSESAEENYPQGTVFSVKSKKKVTGAAREAMIDKQYQDFEAMKNANNAPEKEVTKNNVTSSRGQLENRPFTADEIKGWGAEEREKSAALKEAKAKQFGEVVKSFKTSASAEVKVENSTYTPIWRASVNFPKNAEASKDGTEINIAEKEENASKSPGSEGELLTEGWETAVKPESGIMAKLKEFSPAEYSQARAEWRRVREYYNGETKNGKTLEEEYNEKYKTFLEEQSKGWKGLRNLPRRLFGIRPKLSPELQSLEHESYAVRNRYFETAKTLADQERRPKKGRLTDEQRVKAFERYQGMLGRKLLVEVSNNRKAIRENVALEIEKNSRIKPLLKPVLETIRKNRWLLLGARVAGYGTLAGLTGGVGAAALVGGSYAARSMGAFTVGGAVGTGLRNANDRKLRSLHIQLGEVEGGAQRDLFKNGFVTSEKGIDDLTRQIEETEASGKLAAAGTAIIAGMAGGSLVNGVADSLGILDNLQTPEVPKSGSVKLTPVPESKLQGVPPDLRTPTNPGIPGPHAPDDGSHPRWGDTNQKQEFNEIPPDGLKGIPPDLNLPPTQVPADGLEGIPPDLNLPPGQIPPEGLNGVPPDINLPPTHVPADGLAGIPPDLNLPPTQVPAEGLEGVPPDLNLPPGQVPPEGLNGLPPDLEVKEPAPKAPLIEMGDAKVAEAAQPEVRKAIIEIEEGEKVGPEYRPFDGHIVKEPSSAPEAPVEVPDSKYTVEKGDNVWNIMEGKGPDANPIGGKSEVLKGMSLSERQDALNKLVEYYEHHPDEAKAIGVIKSGGNIHKIYPGEEINVTALDNQLRSLLGIETVKVPYSIPESNASEALESRDSVVVHSEDGEFVIENPVDDINKMTVSDAFRLLEGVSDDDPEALRLLEEMNTDRDSFLEAVSSINNLPGNWQDPANGGLTIQEYLEKFKDTSKAQPLELEVENAEETRFVSDTNEVRNPLDDKSSIAREVSVENSALDNTMVNKYVSDVEKARGFIFREPNVVGTFDKLKDLTFSDMRQMAEAGRLPEGVDAKGWDRWAEQLNKQISTLPAANNETIGQYVARAAGQKLA